MRIAIGRTLILVAAMLLPITIGCGSTGGNSTGSTPATLTSVSAACTPSSVYTGQTSQCSATAHYNDGSTSATSSITWAASSGSINTAGLFTAPATAATVTITATSTQDSTKSGSASVTVTTAPTITSVSVAALPTSITTAQTAQCSATVSGTGAYSSSVTWTATGGTITSSGVLTPTAAGTATCTATSTQDSTKSGSASVTVTLAPPTTTAITPATEYADDPSVFGNLVLTGTNFTSTDTIHVTGCSLSSAGYTNSTQIVFTLDCLGSHYTSGYIGAYVCRSSGSPCSNTSYFASLSYDYKSLAQNNGEFYWTHGGTLYKYKVSGNSLVADGSFTAGGPGVSVDNTTGYIVVGDIGYNSNGVAEGQPSTTGISDDISDVAVKNGIACGTRPSTNYVSCWTINQINAPLTSQTVGSEPISIAMANFGGSTRYDYVVSRGGTPTLWLLLNESMSSSVQLTGFTPVNSYPTVGSLGGWPIVVFESGPANGTVAVLSVADSLLLLLDKGATKVVQSVKLTGTPVSIAKDETNGNVIVAYVNAPATATTGFSAVNAITGAVASRTSTSGQYPNGLLVYGNYIYTAQTTVDVQSNQ